jgi:ribosome-interacting GTPase 1
MMLDASKGEVHKKLLCAELESVGIRINKERPKIYFKPRAKGGGLHFSTQVPLTHMNEKLAREILNQYKIYNADVVFREDATVDEFIDVVEGNRQYIKCLFVYNKIDTITIEEVDKIARSEDSVVISCEWGLNLDYLKDKIWEYLDLLRIYTKKKGSAPDFQEPFIVRNGATIETICNCIHADMKRLFKYALVWGRSVKHSPQRVGLKHQLADEDVVQIVAETV